MVLLLLVFLHQTRNTIRCQKKRFSLFSSRRLFANLFNSSICWQTVKVLDELEPHQAFSFDSNLSHSWQLWLKHFDFYLAATEKDTKGDKIKIFIFLTYTSQKGREIYVSFTFEPGDEMKLAPVLHKFSNNVTLGKIQPFLSHTSSKRVKTFMIL